EALRHRVDLHGDVEFTRRLQHALEVVVVGIAGTDLTAAGVSQDVHDARGQGAHDAFRHDLARLPEVRVDTRHDAVEGGQQSDAQDESAVRGVVHLDAGEQVWATSQLAVEGANPRDVFAKGRFVQAQRSRARVIRNGEIRIAERTSHRGDFLEAALAVGRSL